MLFNRRAAYSLLLVFYWVFLTQPGLLPVFSSPNQTGRVKGTVMDPMGSVVPGVTIIFEGQRKHEVVSDASGEYSIELPEGLYRVTSRVKGEGFLPFRRAAFRVEIGKETLINLSLMPGGVTSHNVPHPPQIGYDSFSIPNSQSVALDLLIQFGTRQKQKDSIEYRGVTISYDALTVYADKARLDPKSFRFEAEGDVVVDNGIESVRVRSVNVNFGASGPDITLIKGAIDQVKGEGALDENVHFTFKVSESDSGHLSYEDKASGIIFISSNIFHFRVTDDVNNAVMFRGAGQINYTIPTQFTVAVQSNGNSGAGRDTFSIKFDSLDKGVYDRSGSLTQGTIEVHRKY
jgi:hypothetical protein